MNKRKVKEIIKQLYSKTDGFKISQQALSKLLYQYIGYTYGEATFDSFYKMLTIIKPKQGEVFYDLGCGLGKKVIIAALCFPFSKSFGIEKLEDLFIVANKINNIFKEEVTLNLKNIAITKIVHGDFREFNFSDADVIYLSVDYRIMEYELKHLDNKLNSLKIGTRLITSNVPFISNKYKIFHEEIMNYASGKAKPIFHIKTL